MSEVTAPIESDNVAWVSFRTPLEKEALIDFCQDVGRLLRINPYIEFEKWVSCGNNRFQFHGRNLSHKIPRVFAVELVVSPTANGIRINYLQGLKSTTLIRAEDAPEGSQLTIIEDYSGTPEEERQARIGEVDKSLVKWAEDLQAYLVRWKRWSGFAPWCWYMRRIWLPMKPTARRITYVLLWVSVVEVALILLGAGIYWSELR